MLNDQRVPIALILCRYTMIHSQEISLWNLPFWGVSPKCQSKSSNILKCCDIIRLVIIPLFSYTIFPWYPQFHPIFRTFRHPFNVFVASQVFGDQLAHLWLHHVVVEVFPRGLLLQQLPTEQELLREVACAPMISRWFMKSSHFIDVFIYVYLSIYLYIYISIYPYIYISIYLYIDISIYLYIYISINPYIYISIYLYIHISTYIYISIYLYIHISIYLYIYISIYPYIYIYIYLYIHISIYLYIHLYLYMYIHLQTCTETTGDTSAIARAKSKENEGWRCESIRTQQLLTTAAKSPLNQFNIYIYMYTSVEPKPQEFIGLNTRTRIILQKIGRPGFLIEDLGYWFSTHTWPVPNPYLNRT